MEFARVWIIIFGECVINVDVEPSNTPNSQRTQSAARNTDDARARWGIEPNEKLSKEEAKIEINNEK